MKAAIISLNKRIILSERNIRSLEAIYFRKWLQSLGRYSQVDFVSTKNQRNEPSEKVDYYKEAAETDINDYDQIFVHNDTVNFIGGSLFRHTIKQIKEVCRFNGTVHYLYTDPNLHLRNIAKVIFDRQTRGTKTDFKTDLRISSDDVNNFANKEWKVIWCGTDFKSYYNSSYSRVNKEQRCLIGRVLEIDFFRYLFNQRKVELQWCPLNQRVYDLVYYGNWRDERANKLSQYLSNNLQKRVIGFDGKKLNVSNTHYSDYVAPEKLAGLVNQAVASIVVGDPDHNNNITTARFFENIHFEVCSFIDIEYDPNKRLYKSDFLKDFMYVKNGDDLVSKVNLVRNDEHLFNRIINEQKTELL